VKPPDSFNSLLPPHRQGNGCKFSERAKSLSETRARYSARCRRTVSNLRHESPILGLRDYGIDHQIGAEEVLDAYIEALVEVFREVRRTLRDDGTVWLNIGDSYTSGGRT